MDDDIDRLVWSLKKRDNLINISVTTSLPSTCMELDFHADTCVGGSNSILLETNGEVATVFSFSEETTPFDKIPIGTIATSWTDGRNVDDVPVQYDINSSHSIQVHGITIPLDMDGVFSYFESRKPTVGRLYGTGFPRD
jgi:hypothetical protein